MAFTAMTGGDMHLSTQELSTIKQETKRMDLSHVPTTQHEIHEKLLNWALWCKPRHSSSVSPMFRHYRHGYEESHAKSECDPISAQAIEKIVGTMPSKHATSLRWWYVFPIPPGRVCRELGLTRAGLGQMVIDSRFMVINRLR